MSNYYTRKELTQILEISEWMLLANEKRWGLYNCRAKLNGRVIRYHAQPAKRELTILGIWPLKT